MAAADNDYLFRELLREQMDLDGRSPRRLAKDTNNSWGHIPGFEPLTTATIRNWIRNKNPSTPRDWKQLAALLQELSASRQAAEQMFTATTRNLDMEDLRGEVNERFKELLAFRNELPITPHERGTIVGTVQGDNSDFVDQPESLSLVPLTTKTSLEASNSRTVVELERSIEQPGKRKRLRKPVQVGVGVSAVSFLAAGVLLGQSDNETPEPGGPESQAVTDFDCTITTEELDQLIDTESITTPFGDANGEFCDELVFVKGEALPKEQPWSQIISYCVINFEEPDLTLWLEISEPEAGWTQLTNDKSFLGPHIPNDTYQLYPEPELAGTPKTITYEQANNHIVGLRIQGTPTDKSSWLFSCKESWEQDDPDTALITFN